MDPLFIGSHTAIDFLNTALAPDGQPVETIGDGHAFVRWLVSANLLDETQAGRLQRRVGAKGVDAAAAEAREFREWAREWLLRWRRAPAANYTKELETLNQWLAHETQHREVIVTDKGPEWIVHSHADSAEEILALLAAQIAAFVVEEDASLLKTCAGPGCTLWFLDRTKAHRRLFCSNAACGNRAKVAAFRKRQRGR
jgi:predicted RNA-binding Zn ribbon-like protein